MSGLADVRLNLVETLDDALAFRSWLGERRPVLGIDTETGGLDWWREPLRLVQVGDGKTAWAISAEEWLGLLRETLPAYSGEIVMHNAKFDVAFLDTADVRLDRSRIHDTKVMAQLVDATAPSGLKFLGRRHVDRSAGQGGEALKERMRKNRWTWRTVPTDLPEYWVYGALDAVLTARLYDHFEPTITDEFADLYDLEMAVQWVLSDMERRGARVDLDYAEYQADRLRSYEQEVRKWAGEEWGINPAAHAQVAETLVGEGVRLTKRTPTGKWSMDSGVLESIEHPLAAQVLNMRKAQKYAKSYFEAILDLADGDVVHCDMKPLGARTGRMSISRPPLQQLPREALVRNCFVPRKGCRLVLCDFDQIEMRLMTHFSQDAGLLEAFESGDDFFVAMARRIYNDPSLVKDDPRRSLTKNASYAKAYGAGADKFAVTAKVTKEEAETFLQTYDATFPGVKQFMGQVERVARKRLDEEDVAYVRTPFGRRQVSDPDAVYRLVNYLIQGTAADLFKRALVDLDAAGLGEYLVLPVHDEAVADVPTREAEDVAHEIERLMEVPDEFAVPLTAGAETVDRWGEKYE